jgi:hypothetical protein
MSVCCEFCVLSGRGLCDGADHSSSGVLPTVAPRVCDQKSSWMRRPWPALGRSAMRNKPKWTDSISRSNTRWKLDNGISWQSQRGLQLWRN